MNAKDDPEARIRELERPLTELAKAAELTVSSGSVDLQASPPRDNVSRIAIVTGVLAAVVVFGATAAAAYLITGAPRSTTSGQADAPSRVAPAPPPRPVAPVPGGIINITGAGETKTVVCVGNYVFVGGAHNTVALTGQCAGLAVSGVGNVITVDSASRITVSGVRNRVTYRSGDPEVGNAGLENVIERG